MAQYFWPENLLINDLAKGLKERGHEVIVFTGKPNYPAGKFFKGYSMFGQRKEEWNGITIYRVPLIARGNSNGINLFINYCSFVFFGCIRALFLPVKPDVILVYQQSPITVAIPAMIFKLKSAAKSFMYVQDLWPESIVATTAIKNKLVIKVLYGLCNWMYNSTDIVIIQSKAFRSYLINRKIDPEKIIYLANTSYLVYQIKDRSAALEKYFTSAARGETLSSSYARGRDSCPR